MQLLIDKLNPEHIKQILKKKNLLVEQPDIARLVLLKLGKDADVFADDYFN